MGYVELVSFFQKKSKNVLKKKIDSCSYYNIIKFHFVVVFINNVTLLLIRFSVFVNIMIYVNLVLIIY